MSKYTFFVLILVTLAIGAVFYSGKKSVNFYRQIFPDVSILQRKFPIAVSKHNQRIQYHFSDSRPQHWRTLKQISGYLPRAVLTAEDSGFYQHSGFEPEAMRQAWINNHRPGAKIIRGGSTITQQVVKNLFLTQEKTLTRKFRELLLALDLERTFSKNQILEVYLNIVEWGKNVYGAEQASQLYFHKSAALLSAREAATLAFLLPNPIVYGRSILLGEPSGFARSRIEIILHRMWKSGAISDSEYSSSLLQKAISL